MITTTAGGKPVREGSAVKRAAILAAARDLFLRDGFAQVSMDAVAAQAGVSKRTVYDYFGDKQHLMHQVVLDAADSLLAALTSALDTHLADDAGIETVEQLEQALIALALELADTVVGSADYATVLTLLSKQRSLVATLPAVAAEPEDAVAERLAHFNAVGLLDAPDPRLAADHFKALTVLLAHNDQPDPDRADAEQVHRTMVNGVRTFIRAYAKR